MLKIISVNKLIVHSTADGRYMDLSLWIDIVVKSKKHIWQEKYHSLLGTRRFIVRRL